MDDNNVVVRANLFLANFNFF